LVKSFAFVEMRVGYWLAKGDCELLVFMSKSFVGQIKHFQIPFHPEKSPEIGQPVKKR
jgi:imidazoleglycerol phosphate synthase glutamine amidotransferase subunit HisH